MSNIKYTPPRLVDTGDYVLVIPEVGKWHNYMYFNEASQYVDEGGAYVKDYRTIVLMGKDKVKRTVLDRDSRYCKYCKKAGHSVLMIIPKKDGGKYTPKNCVCACQKCFLKKTRVKTPIHKKIIYFIKRFFKIKNGRV